MNKKLDNYPELTPDGIEQVVNFFDKIKVDAAKTRTKEIEKSMDILYNDIGGFIESDTWTNYRMAIIEMVSGYSELSDFESKPIRDAIYREHKDELVRQLNQDLVKENASLNRALAFRDGVVG